MRHNKIGRGLLSFSLAMAFFAGTACSAHRAHAVPHDPIAAPTADSVAPVVEGDATAECRAGAGPTVADLLGSYTVVSVDRYRGGLTNRAEARAWLGKTMLLATDVFRFDDHEIASPRYEISCHDLARQEGEVPTSQERLLSAFWGVAPERGAIWTLHARDAEGRKQVGFEVAPGLGAPDLWFLHDGWIFVLSRDVDALRPRN